MARPKTEIIYENTVPARFVRRINRFTAEVMIDGLPEIVHVKNTGRLGELLLPNAKVTLQKAADPNRKTAYDLISVYKPRLKWVNIDSLAPNMLMRQYWENSGIFDVIRPEYKYGNSRVDFYMESGDRRYLREVKGVHSGRGYSEWDRTFPECTDRARRKASARARSRLQRRISLQHRFCDTDERDPYGVPER